ncbi:MAG: menaquinone biosynthesis protein [Euryarchaeota archaeon]|nr:menaquinone biosynthesis protein [Euryarchaeota archaeon]
MSLRIGTTHFKNTDFILYAVKRGLVTANGASYHTGHPPALGRMLREGTLDIAPTSSIIYAQNHRDLLILPDFSINARGRTMSILLFSDEILSLRELEARRVTVPGTSASSSALLEIILKWKDIHAEIIHHEEPDLDSMLDISDAALLIGDQALKANYDGRTFIADLGEEWARLTGKKMVYALWVITKEAAEREPEKVREFYHALRRSRELAYRNLGPLFSTLARELGVSMDFMMRHLTTLDYTLGKEEMEGLEEYFRQARRFGILDEMPGINLFEV